MSKWELNPTHPLTPAYEQWVDDCTIHALLAPKNNCTAMRGVLYDNKSWDIHNHFFWLSRADAIALYTAHNAVELVQDAQAHPIRPYNYDADTAPSWIVAGDPYLSHVLPNLKLSLPAKDALAALNAMFIAAIPHRATAAAELHLGAWDAGVYQLNRLMKDTPEYKTCRDKAKALARHIEHGVYTYGFLHK